MMLLAAKTVFWLSLATVLYTYFGYALVLFVCYGLAQVRRDLRYLGDRRDRRRAELEDADLPPVTMLFTAYNEEEHLHEKLQNTRELDYPPKKLQVVVVSDGSTDRTNEVLSELNDRRFDVVLQQSRTGKATALRVAVKRARNNILVLSDSSTMFVPDALRKLVRHFSDPKVGAVCGALSFQANAESRQTEGVYWKYETALRLMEARLGATLTPSGAIYAVRSQAYAPPSPDALVDDIVTLMHVRQQGYRVHYDPEAKAVDYPASSVAGEFRRRVRISTGSFRALPGLLRVPMTGFTALAFFSHKLLRWLAPLFLLLLLGSNLFLLRERFYAVAFVMQAAVLLWAALGYLFRPYLVRVRFALIAYFMVAMNLAFLVGMVRSLGPRRENAW